MGKLVFKIPTKKTPDLAISVSEIISRYLYGVPLCNHQGQDITNSDIENKIKVAQSQVENMLYIKLKEQIIRESSNFVREEWNQYGYVQTSYNVKEPLLLEGYYNQIKQIAYPTGWLNVRREVSSVDTDKEVLFRTIHIVPSGSTGNPQVQGVTYNGATPFAMFMGLQWIPNYWYSTYITGFKRVPDEIVDFIGKLVAIQLLVPLGEVYKGVGMSSYSISLDGLSQSTSMIKSGEYGVYGSRIKSFTNELFGSDGKGGTLEYLKGKYRGFNFNTV